MSNILDSYVFTVKKKKITKKMDFYFPETSLIINAWKEMTLHERNFFNKIAMKLAQGGFYIFQRGCVDWFEASQLKLAAERGEISWSLFYKLFPDADEEWLNSLDGEL